MLVELFANVGFFFFVHFSFTDDAKFLKNFSKTKPRNCDDIYNAGNRINGIYYIFTGKRIVKVFCELEQIGNNWLVSI